jgi:serine/threonine protein kinase
LHRDIKPENILVLDKDDFQVCFADLGLACRDNDITKLYIKCGTPSYVDPAVLNGKQFTAKSDVFSMGALLFNLLTKKLLFSGKTVKEILRSNMNDNP